jgi:hypothetical protein
MTKPTRKQRKRAAIAARAQELLVLRAELSLLCDGNVPQYWIGRNTHQTRKAIRVAQINLAHRSIHLTHG